METPYKQGWPLRHYKTISQGLELKADRKRRTIEGYYTVFGVRDLVNETVLAGSLAKSIAARFPRIPLLFQHDVRMVIGRPVVMEEDSRGVHFVDRIAKTKLGDEALVLASDEDGGPYIDGMSFGYEIVATEELDDGSLGLKELDVFEHSLVTFPANPEARTVAVKDAFGRHGSLWLKQDTISALAMSTSLDKGPRSVASALSLILDQSTGNRTEAITKMAEALSIDVAAVHLILAGQPACPTKDTITKMADVLAIDPLVLLAAGVRGGCDYDLPGEVIEVTGDGEKSVHPVKSVIPYKRYPLDDGDWDGPAEVAAADVDDLRIMSAWYDADAADTKAAYKLPHHRADGYATVWRGVTAAMAALNGARAELDVPDADRQGIYRHLARHYEDFEREPPALRTASADLETLRKSIADLSMSIEEGVHIDVLRSSIARLSAHLQRHRSKS